MIKKHWANIIFFGLVALAWVAICKFFDTPFALNTIDYFSFFVGTFLITEASYKIFTSRQTPLTGQVPRLIRIIFGTCVFTIHLLQYLKI
ncbi:MAG: hypothetical protein PHW46_03500 [Candidatus Omnitrophica bacterium]|nr:hypothetical protein [Candidatus Omnitrophota bacterium]